MAAEESWFVAERTEALAILYLTRHGGLDVIPVQGMPRIQITISWFV
jgi:hypothetical protein